MCLYSSLQNFMKKISNFGVDFDQYFYVSIDFVLNTLIENIGQNQLPKLFFFMKFCILLNLNLNSLLMKRQIYNPSPGAVTWGN